MNKKILTSLIALSLITTSCSSLFSTNEDKHKEIDLSIIHINDHHSYLEGTEQRIKLNGKSTKVNVGGFSAINAEIKELRAKRKNPIVLHAGDAITGTLYFTLFNGSADAAVMNAGNFDFFTLGNHEFDAGNEGLLKLLKPLKVPVISANVVAEETSILANRWKPYEVIEVEGEKVGIIGLDTVKKTVNSSSPGKDIHFFDEIETADKYAKLLKEQGINKIILLSHAGTEKNFEIAEKVNDIDIIVTGDSHYLYGNDELRALGLPVIHNYPVELKAPNGEPVFVVEAWSYSNVVGDLGVHFTKDGIASITRKIPHVLIQDTKFQVKDSNGKWTELKGEEREAAIDYIKNSPTLTLAKEDAETKKILDKYKAEKDLLAKQVIGSINGPDMPAGSANRIPGREGSNPQGSIGTRFVAEVMLNELEIVDYTIQNSGGVRENIHSGQVTFNDAYTYLPFGNTLYTYKISGKDTMQVIEDALQFALVDGSTGAFPYGAGIRYEANEFPNKDGKRLVKVEVFNKKTKEWELINPEKMYTIGTNAYIASGKDGYKTFGRLYKDPKAEGTDTFLPDAESFIKFMKANPSFKSYETSNVIFHNNK